MSSDKSSALILVLFSALAAVLSSCGASSDDTVTAATEWSVAAKAPVAVETETVSREPFIRGIEASGILEGIREADVVSETSGIIESVTFEIGDFVREGEVLLTVEDRIARINSDFARQDLLTAELEFEAVEKSYKTGGTSLVAYNQSLTRVEAARLRYEQAAETLGNTVIAAPFSGSVSARESFISPGNYLNPGTAVTHIVDTSSFQIRLSVGEGEISLIHPGSAALVTVNPFPDRVTEAVVKAVSPGSSRSGGGFPVVVVWENNGNGDLKSGMSARVTISPGEEAAKELIIPASAVVYRNGLPFVFRVRDSAAEAVEIRIRRSLGNRVALESGPEEGDRVIVSGLASLVPGDPVLPAPEEDDPEPEA